MLKHKHTIGLQQVVLENEVRNGGKFRQSIRWISKNQVKLLAARLDKAEHIATNE